MSIIQHQYMFLKIKTMKKIITVILGMFPIYILLYSIYLFFDYLLVNPEHTYYKDLFDIISVYNSLLGTIFFSLTYLIANILIIGSLYFTYQIFKNETIKK